MVRSFEIVTVWFLFFKFSILPRELDELEAIQIAENAAISEAEEAAAAAAEAINIGADFDVSSEADKAFINKMGGLDNLGYDKSPEDMKNEVSGPSKSLLQ